VRFLAGGFDDGFAGGDVGAERLLAQDVLVGFNGADGLGSVLGCDAGDADSFEAGVFEHLVEVFVDLCAVWGEVLGCPCACVGVWVTGGYQFGTRSLLKEVTGVASTHTAEARDGDLELANHCACWGSVRWLVGRRSDRKEVLEEMRQQIEAAVSTSRLFAG